MKKFHNKLFYLKLGNSLRQIQIQSIVVVVFRNEILKLFWLPKLGGVCMLYIEYIFNTRFLDYAIINMSIFHYNPISNSKIVLELHFTIYKHKS